MKIEKSNVEKIRISGLENMDPITVYVEDFYPGAGSITIKTAWGENAWANSWSHMGEKHTMRSFFVKCENAYLIGKLAPSLTKEIVDEDLDKLIILLKKKIIERRREDSLSHELARSLWDEVIDLCHWEDRSDVCFEIFGDEWWYKMPTQSNPAYEELSKIIEIVREAFKQELENVDSRT